MAATVRAPKPPATPPSAGSPALSEQGGAPRVASFEYDKSSKWLISHHGGSLLRLGGWTDVVRWRALPGEVAQPRRFPDGIVEATFAGASEPALVGIEIATYSDRRVAEQMLRNLLLIYSDNGVMPEMMVVVLQPKGDVDVADHIERIGPTGATRLAASWRVVRMWELQAEELLAAGDVGLVPWVPLTRFEGPVEPLLRRCRERLDDAPAGERANLLAVSQVLTGLRFKSRALLELFGGNQAMIESPVIEELLLSRDLYTRRMVLLESLADELGAVPEDVRVSVDCIDDVERIRSCSRALTRFTGWDDVRKWLRDNGAGTSAK